MKANCILDCRNSLGESCFWDPRDSCLYWTDIEESRIFRLAPDDVVSEFPLPERAGFIKPRRGAGFVIGFASRIALSNASLTNFTTIATIEADLPQTRVNDAAVDPFGGIVFGTMDERDRQPVASLYRITLTGEVTRLLSGVTVSNGLALSPDGTVMYFADTPVGIIRRFAVGPDFANFEEIEPLAGVYIAPGKPDGAAVDKDGHYWSARVWGGCLARISPEGRLTDTIELEARAPTCVALGGKDGNRLFATTLRVRHSAEELQATPHAGSLFAIDVAVPGIPERLSLL